MFDKLIKLVFLAVGLWLLITAALRVSKGSRVIEDYVYIAVGAVLILYNLKVVTALTRSS